MAEENNQYTFENEQYRRTYWPVSYTHLTLPTILLV